MIKSELAKLPTKRILAYKRIYFPSCSYPYFVEDYVWDCNCKICQEEKMRIAAYENEYDLIKQELATREHIPQKNRSRCK
jgi:hypothetical protein